MKKPYSKPTIFRVKLNHEQAVLGTCVLTGYTSIKDAIPTQCRTDCKQKSGGGSATGTS